MSNNMIHELVTDYEAMIQNIRKIIDLICKLIEEDLKKEADPGCYIKVYPSPRPPNKDFLGSIRVNWQGVEIELYVPSDHYFMLDFEIVNAFPALWSDAKYSLATQTVHRELAFAKIQIVEFTRMVNSLEQKLVQLNAEKPESVAPEEPR